MAEKKQEVQTLLERLRSTMDESQISEEQKALLRKVEYHIHNEDEPDPAEPSVRESLETLIEDLSIDHPRSAGLARSLLETLAAIGI